MRRTVVKHFGNGKYEMSLRIMTWHMGFFKYSNDKLKLCQRNCRYFCSNNHHLDHQNCSGSNGHEVENRERYEIDEHKFHGSINLSQNHGSRPRGTVDLFGEECDDIAFVEDQGRRVSELAGFKEIRTPVFEFNELYSRSLGVGSDVVSKEMFSFLDRSDNLLTLRPENTAGVVRALMSKRSSWPGAGAKAFYYGPMFRYERPQYGRQRQFTQFGIEMLGFAGPSTDVESIALAAKFLSNIGLLNKTRLLVNTLGDNESRMRYSSVLCDHFSQFDESQLSTETQIRLRDRRTLRILDSKEAKDQQAISTAPNPHNSLNEQSAERFDRFLSGLDTIGVKYELDPGLVRGLDYYSHSVFEFVLEGAGSGNRTRPMAVLAGGRYDGLAQCLGCKENIPAIGWAAGIERLCLERKRLGLPNLHNQKKGVFILPILNQEENINGLEESSTGILGDKIKRYDLVKQHAVRLAHNLRDHDVQVHLWHAALDAHEPIKSAIRKGFKQAERLECCCVAVVGIREAEAGNMSASFKDLNTGNNSSLVDWASWEIVLENRI